MKDLLLMHVAKTTILLTLNKNLWFVKAQMMTPKKYIFVKLTNKLLKFHSIQQMISDENKETQTMHNSCTQ